jgi:protein SCO1/2
MAPSPARLLASLLLGCALLWGACAPRHDTVAAPVPQEKRYPLTGTILEVRKNDHTLLVAHDEIVGFMPAMTMEFKVSPAELEAARENQRIRATLVEPEQGDLRLEEVWPAEKVTDDSLAAAARRLRDDTASRGRAAYREIGETLPAFTLLNQRGELVPAGRFKGKVVMLNFIYTRCPFPDMCPLSTTKMKRTQALAAEAGVRNLELVSISLDPEHDTPGVLAEYVRNNAIDASNFTLLTGPREAVADLLTQFGILAKLDGGIVRHTLATLLIDPEGRILHRADGNAWEPADFVARMPR